MPEQREVLGGSMLNGVWCYFERIKTYIRVGVLMLVWMGPKPDEKYGHTLFTCWYEFAKNCTGIFYLKILPRCWYWLINIRILNMQSTYKRQWDLNQTKKFRKCVQLCKTWVSRQYVTYKIHRVFECANNCSSAICIARSKSGRSH